MIHPTQDQARPAACFFALDELTDSDGVIYAYRDQSYIPIEEYPDPFGYKEVGKFVPRHLIRRITAQGGLFTIHPNPYESFASEDMDKIIVPHEMHAEPRTMLNKYGVNQFSLFPSLDGLSARMEWLQSKKPEL